jgi:hypothetical protein
MGELGIVEFHRRKENWWRFPEVLRREPGGDVEVVPHDLLLAADDAGPSTLPKGAPARLEHALIVGELEEV